MKSRRVKRAILEKDRENAPSDPGEHAADDKLAEICIAGNVHPDYQGYGQRSVEQNTNDLDEDVLERMDFLACLSQFIKMRHKI